MTFDVTQLRQWLLWQMQTLTKQVDGPDNDDRHWYMAKVDAYKTVLSLIDDGEFRA